MKNLLFFISLMAAFQAYSQHSLKVGVGMHKDLFYGTAYLIEDSLMIDGQDFSDDPRPAFYLHHNVSIKNRLKFEYGIGFYKTYFSYAAAKRHARFGFIEKIGVVSHSAFNLPVNLEYSLLSFLSVKAGLSYTFGKLTKSGDTYFNDVPEVNELYNLTPHAYKNNFLNTGVGISAQFKQFHLNYFFTRSITPVSDPVIYESVSYKILNKVATHHLQLTYEIAL